jgi:hypothetical protein
MIRKLLPLLFVNEYKLEIKVDITVITREAFVVQTFECQLLFADEKVVLPESFL